MKRPKTPLKLKTVKARLSAAKAILFDMGNTIYDENSYMQQAFKMACLFLSKKHKLNPSSTYKLLTRIWKIKARHYEFLLSDLMQILGIYSDESLKELLNIYHTIKPKLKPYPGVLNLLRMLKKKHKIALLTDGNPVMKRNKIKALGLGLIFNNVIHADEHNTRDTKKSSYIFRLALQKLGCAPGQAVYVADNPYSDFKGAKELGIFTVRVLQGEFKNIFLDSDYEADISIKRLSVLGKLLK